MIRAGRRHPDIRGIILRREEFKGSAMTGKSYPDGWPSLDTFGYLPRDFRERFERERDGVGIDYVVFSYDTPIAWHRIDWTWVRPEVKYSPTTSLHQGCCPRTSEGIPEVAA